ncbi:WbqC family protein [Nonomuraea recticatena]|uniref:WbqC family protein n=1 Tax=Nonomuraea recticatena TaxID=46178 RepID=A0ABN3TF27_9ACTN
MTPTSLFSAPDSTAAFSAPDAFLAGARRVAIHQPNLFPRLTTLAKLWAADCWVVLDNVQFARRDYQHRARLAALTDPGMRQWLSLATHLPEGQPTLIGDALLADPARSQRRVGQLLQQLYGRSRHWPLFQERLGPLLSLFNTTDRLAAISEASTLILLRLLGWRGQIMSSSDLPARLGRSRRLADLAKACGARTYLCGTGGMRYLAVDAFTRQGIHVTAFRTPSEGVWASAREVSAVRALMVLGPKVLARELSAVAVAQS